VTAIRAAWQIDPAIAIFVTERTRNAAVQQEVVRLVKSNTREALDVPEALRFLLGETSTRRDLKVSCFIRTRLVCSWSFKYLLLWAPVTPIVAVTYFQQGARDPLLLQYAHRVLEQHPVDLTFFFVPQIVQALRFDDLGA
jgi:phosphatidylinositol 4-kinase